MQPCFTLLRRPYQDEILVTVSDDDVRDDLTIFGRNLRGGAIDEEVLRCDDIEDGPRVVANQAPRKERLQIDCADDHHLLVLHRNASSTASCRRPFEETPLPRSARG